MLLYVGVAAAVVIILSANIVGGKITKCFCDEEK